jgi:hypothetical protein
LIGGISLAVRYTDYDEIGDWAKRDVTIATILRLMYGYPDGTFRPQEPVTREQMAAMSVRILGYSVIFSTGIVATGILLSNWLERRG